MKMMFFAFDTVDRSIVEPTRHAGETGMAIWHTRYFGDKSDCIRVRMVEYTPGYLADHWCKRGHILFCPDGKLETTLEDSRTLTSTPGMSYQAGDDVEAHQPITRKSA